MSKQILSILIFGLAHAAVAQTMVDLRTQGKSPDFSSMASTRPIKVVQTLPSTCVEGEFAFRSEITTGGRIFACSSAGVWVQQSTPDLATVPSGAILISNGLNPEWATVGGDISGAPGSISVTKILNRPLSSTAPQTGQALIWDGTNWVPQFASTSSSTVAIKSGTTTVSNTGVANFIAGTGILTSLTPVNGEAVIQQSADTTLLETRTRAQSGEPVFCSSPTGDGLAYTCSLSPTLPTYNAGLVLHWLPQTNGSGGATTLRVGNLAITALKLIDGSSNPEAGDIIAGRIYTVWYDGTVFRLLNRSGSSAQAAFCSSASASATAYTCATSMPLNSYTTGLTLFWRADVDATGGATTLKIGALAATAVKLPDGSTNPEAGDIVAGRVYTVWYDGTVFRLTSVSSILAPSTATQPTCAVGLRGRIWFGQGGTGVKDSVSVCAKDAANTYAWRTLY